jgi:hypothetical protein
MKSVFDPADNADFVGRIDKLSPASPALWGKMNVAQMLAHCQMPIKVGCGELTIRGGLIGLLFGRMAKKKLVNEEPFEHNLPTFKEAKIKETEGFEIEKEKLKKLVQRFAQGPETITLKKHPFFGPLTKQEWDVLQSKHLDHHLRQFGV